MTSEVFFTKQHSNIFEGMQFCLLFLGSKTLKLTLHQNIKCARNHQKLNLNVRFMLIGLINKKLNQLFHSLIANTWHRSVGEVVLQELDPLSEVRIHRFAGTSCGVYVTRAGVSRLTATFVQNAEVGPGGCVTFI